MKNQLRSIQILRAAAALAVVLFHFGLSLQLDFQLLPANPFPAGSAGVDVFFVISGFIMCYTTARADQRSPREFATKRLARIIPIYYLLTLALFVLGLAMPSLLSTGGATVEQLVKSLLFIPYENASGAVQPVLFLGWTLNYEMFFYAVFAVTLLVAPRFRVRVVAGFMTLLVAIGLVLGYTGNAIATFYTSGILMEFVWGCLVFLAFDRYPGALKTMSPLWLAGLAALVAQNFYEVPLPREIERGLPAALIVMSVVGLEIKDGPLQRTFSRIGDASYSLYLGHLYMLAVVTRSVIALLGTSVLSAAIAGVFSVLVSIAFAMLCFYLLERPANAWIRRLTMPRRGTPSGAP